MSQSSSISAKTTSHRISAPALNLEPKVTCPHCWHAFAPDQILWISEHHELLGDPVLGSEAPMRFIPSRFTADCKAIDARGMACVRLACPRCHLPVPRQLLACVPYFVSIIGVPAAGKSYFLTSMVWHLRQQMPAQFKLLFTDADPEANQNLLEYEQTLFLQEDSSKVVALRKTELQGELYDQVRLGEHVMTLPHPFMFFVKPTDEHPNATAPDSAKLLHKVFCLYDNAGEHFQPGMETSGSPVTQHLGRARLLIYLFDPTQDVRFRSKLNESAPTETARVGRVQRQETILIEAAARVRRQVGLADGARHRRPLIIVLPKLDEWERLLDEPIGDEPFISGAIDGRIDAVDFGRVESVSAKCRVLMSKLCPELVAAADQFCEHVVFIPTSATGTAPVRDEATGLLGFRPRDIKPRWTTVPLLYGLAKWSKGLIGGTSTTTKAPARSLA